MSLQNSKRHTLLDAMDNKFELLFNERVDAVNEVKKEFANIDGIKAHMNDHTNCALSKVNKEKQG